MFLLKKYKSFCRSSRTGKNSILNYKKNGIYRLAKNIFIRSTTQSTEILYGSHRRC
nr:MAG TPA: hypothetical protein [Caudoviricetes sp.]